MAAEKQPAKRQDAEASKESTKDPKAELGTRKAPLKAGATGVTKEVVAETSGEVQEDSKSKTLAVAAESKSRALALASEEKPAKGSAVKATREPTKDPVKEGDAPTAPAEAGATGEAKDWNTETLGATQEDLESSMLAGAAERGPARKPDAEACREPTKDPKAELSALKTPWKVEQPG